MKRIAWLAVLSVLALMLVACSTPAQPETQDSTDPAPETTTTLAEGDSTTDSAEDTATEGDSASTTDTTRVDQPTVGASTTATTEGDKPTTDKTTEGKTTASTKDKVTTKDTTTGNTTKSTESKTTAPTKNSITAKTEGEKTTKPTKPTTAPSDNVVNWEDLFGDDTTQQGETTTTTQTTKTTATTTTGTTQKPQVVDEVTLPAVGTDVDGRGRIFLSAAELKNGVVTLTLHNATDEKGQKWQTEETNYVTYACYDANGKLLEGKGDYYGTFYIGALQAGEDVTTTFPLPEGTVKVELTGAKIVYWTPWS